MQKPSLLGLQRPPRPAAEVAAAAAARVRAWAAERCDEDVDALLLEAAQQVTCKHKVTQQNQVLGDANFLVHAC